MNHISRNSVITSFLIAFSVSLSTGHSDETGWTRFRGSNGAGLIERCNVPIPWDDADKCWEIDLPGKGNSSPVAWGNRLFVMSADPKSAERYLLAVDLKTGEELWRRTFASTPHKLHGRSSYASSTPCVDAQGVYIAFADPQHVVLAAFSHEGDELWRKDLGPFVSQHGFGASPALFGDKLILFNSQQAEQLDPGQQPGESRVMAFSAQSGEKIWETPRTTTRVCYGVPTQFDAAGKPALLFSNTGDGLFALDLATGAPLWNKEVFTKRSVSCPIIVGNLAIGTEGSGGGGNILFAVNLAGDHEVAFAVERAAPYVPTPVAKGNLLFLWSDVGIVSCIQVPENEVKWSKRISGNVSTSPVIAGDKLIGISEDGTLTVLGATAEFKELGSIKLDDTVRATPLLSENYIVVRSDSKMICIGKP